MRKFTFKSVFSVGKNTTDSISTIIVVLSILIVAITLGVLIFPEQYSRINKGLESFTNILSLLNFAFAWLALLIAIFAYKSSVLRPRLSLRVIPLQQVEDQVKLRVDLDGNVSAGRPLNEWSLILSNDGEASAKYPMVRMMFKFDLDNGKYFGKDAFQGWKAVSHAHGRGYYGFQWTPEDSAILYPGFSMSLPKLYFWGKCFESDFTVTFTFIADGVRSTTLRIPVQIERVEENLSSLGRNK